MSREKSADVRVTHKDYIFMLTLNAQNEKIDEKESPKKKEFVTKGNHFTKSFLEKREIIESNVKKRIKSMQKKKASQRKVHYMHQWDTVGPNVHSFVKESDWYIYRELMSKTTHYDGFDKPQIELSSTLLPEQEHKQRSVLCELCHQEIDTYGPFRRYKDTVNCRHLSC
jgi:hypothetical protein